MSLPALWRYVVFCRYVASGSLALADPLLYRWNCRPFQGADPAGPRESGAEGSVEAGRTARFDYSRGRERGRAGRRQQIRGGRRREAVGLGHGDAPVAARSFGRAAEGVPAAAHRRGAGRWRRRRPFRGRRAAVVRGAPHPGGCDRRHLDGLPGLFALLHRTHSPAVEPYRRRPGLRAGVFLRRFVHFALVPAPRGIARAAEWSHHRAQAWRIVPQCRADRPGTERISRSRVPALRRPDRLQQPADSAALPLHGSGRREVGHLRSRVHPRRGACFCLAAGNLPAVRDERARICRRRRAREPAHGNRPRHERGCGARDLASAGARCQGPAWLPARCAAALLRRRH
jgi:hypothetical protein